jgi:ADP-ribose pyrophosphatase YjhB (NUDIX family)
MSALHSTIDQLPERLDARQCIVAWAFNPGGAMDIGETIADCARREVLEETGLTVEVQSIVGLYSDPGHVFAYDDGEDRQEFSICFHARVLNGAIQASDESHEVRFFKPEEIDDLPMVEPIRLRITDYLKRDQPAIR